MTAIAAFRMNGVPFLVGDLLITDKQLKIPHIFLPTAPGSNVLPGFGERSRRAGMRLKLSIINDNLAVGFTGHVNAGEQLMRGLRAEFGQGGATTMRLAAYLAEAHKPKSMWYPNGNGVEVLYDAELVGWIADPEPQCFQFSMIPGKPLQWHPETARGTGAQHFSRARAKNNSYGEASDTPAAALVAVVRAGYGVVMSEVLVKSTFYYDYGYGFETVYWNKFRFCFIERHAALLCTVDVPDKKAAVVCPYVLRTYERRGNLAVIQNRLLQGHIGSRGMMEGPKCYHDMITSIEVDDRDKPEPPPFYDFAPEVACAVVNYYRPDSGMNGRLSVAACPPEQGLVAFTNPAPTRPEDFGFSCFNGLMLQLKEKVADRPHSFQKLELPDET